MEREITLPNYYANQSRPVLPRAEASRAGPDARYGGVAGLMEDGRGVTDYRSKCEANVPAGSQFATKRWMQANAGKIMEASIVSQMQQNGAFLGVRMDLEPRAAQEVRCDPYGCRTVGGSETGIGMERLEGCPPLFGTFEPAVGSGGPQLLRGRLLTRVQEGGRNSIRGGAGQPVPVDDRLPWEPRR